MNKRELVGMSVRLSFFSQLVYSGKERKRCLVICTREEARGSRPYDSIWISTRLSSLQGLSYICEMTKEKGKEISPPHQQGWKKQLKLTYLSRLSQMVEASFVLILPFVSSSGLRNSKPNKLVSLSTEAMEERKEAYRRLQTKIRRSTSLF